MSVLPPHLVKEAWDAVLKDREAREKGPRAVVERIRELHREGVPVERIASRLKVSAGVVREVASSG